MGAGKITIRTVRNALLVGALFPFATLAWRLPTFNASVSLGLSIICVLLCLTLLPLRFSLPKSSWLRLWFFASPWLLTSVFLLPGVPVLPVLPLLLVGSLLLGGWGAANFYPFQKRDQGLHTARFAMHDEIEHLLSTTPPPQSLLLGCHKPRHVLSVLPTKTRRELGNLLIVAPTRGGKGLLATSQLLSWQHSVIVNDIKGDLFTATAGYRSTLGPVFVIDPTGIGRSYDPLQRKHSEDEVFSAATHLLFQTDEGEGRIFTQRAIVMLTQLLLAATLEGMAPLPYVRLMIRAGLAGAAKRLQAVSPTLATQFLDVNFAEANLSDRFLLSAWGTLSARIRPLLTETVVRCFTHSDFDAHTLMQSTTPVTVYFRWKEQDLLALSPLVRLLWGTLIDELITTYDQAQGKGCQPVLLLIDEAGKTAIPTLADHAATVVGRGISLWIAVQSLSQLEAVYGKARSHVLRDNMENQLYYRPTDLATAQYLEERLGMKSAYAHSTTTREGAEPSEGLSEKPIPLLTAQEILQLKDEEIISFHRQLPPVKISRMDWREYPLLRQRHGMLPPSLARLHEIADLPINRTMHPGFDYAQDYIDPDLLPGDTLLFEHP